ncbi:MAG: peroxiredoxin family protein [Mycoplasma sp.]|nr:peroxiredoxin family protein [Mycoplasma sp.]
MKKILIAPMIIATPILLSSTLLSCKVENKQEENTQQALENFVNNLNLTIKENRVNEKSKTLASTIKTEKDLNEWFDNLPFSEEGINAIFSATWADDKKGELHIKYLISKNECQIVYEKTENGFMIRDKSQDQIDVENFIKTLNDPVIKDTKKSQMVNTPASTIRTKENLKEWFDGLWISDESKGIDILFSKTQTNNDNSDISKGTLRVYYEISKGEYSTTVYWETPGFQIESLPSVTPPTSGYTKYTISLKRSNGKYLESFFPTIKFFKEDGSLYGEKWFTSSLNQFELPSGTYKGIIETEPPNGMAINKEFTFSTEKPNYDIIFTPKDLQNTPIPNNYLYTINDVLYKSEYTDINGNTFKLSDNIKSKKVTLFVFFKIDCPYCAAMEAEIASWKKDNSLKERFEVWAFSGHDSNDRLKNWALGYEDFRVFSDPNFVVRKQFDNTSNPERGVPKFFFVDQEGVYVSQTGGQVSNLKDYLLKLLD